MINLINFSLDFNTVPDNIIKCFFMRQYVKLQETTELSIIKNEKATIY